MDKNITSLYDFIDGAVRSRKYPENTGHGLKAALKLFETELSDEEKASINLFADRLEQIYKSVCSKNQLKFSAGSLATYKSRVVKVLTDYQKYGVDPTKMATWSPKVVTRRPRVANAEKSSTKGAEQASDSPATSLNEDERPASSSVERFQIWLDNGQATILLPINRSKNDVLKLTKFIEFIEATSSFEGLGNEEGRTTEA